MMDAVLPPMQVTRLEVSRRYRLQALAPVSNADATEFAALVHDRMTEQASRHAVQDIHIW